MTRVIPLLFALSACTSTDPAVPPAEPTPPTGDGLFSEGCPPVGGVVARVIRTSGRLPGEAAVGTAGDFLLANERAAFVVTDTVGQSTYWYCGSSTGSRRVPWGLSVSTLRHLSRQEEVGPGQHHPIAECGLLLSCRRLALGPEGVHRGVHKQGVGRTQARASRPRTGARGRCWRRRLSWDHC